MAKLDPRGALPLNFHGPGGTIQTHSAAALSEADLDGKIVFLGATATGFGDLHPTSFDTTMPGVEAHATRAANLPDGRTLRRDMTAWGLDAALAVAVALAGFWAGGLRRAWLSRRGPSARSFRRHFGVDQAYKQASPEAEARSMTHSGNRSVDAIAQDVGFSSAASFHKAFQRWTGKSPSVYRRKRGGDL